MAQRLGAGQGGPIRTPELEKVAGLRVVEALEETVGELDTHRIGRDDGDRADRERLRAEGDVKLVHDRVAGHAQQGREPAGEEADGGAEETARELAADRDHGGAPLSVST